MIAPHVGDSHRCQNSKIREQTSAKVTMNRLDSKLDHHQRQQQQSSTFISPSTSPQHVKNYPSVPPPAYKTVHPPLPLTKPQHRYDQPSVEQGRMSGLPSYSTWKSSEGGGKIIATSTPPDGVHLMTRFPNNSTLASQRSDDCYDDVKMDDALEVIPKALSKAELETDMEIGTMVEIDISGVCQYGVIRWIGFLDDRNRPIAGIELVS